VRILLSNDDGYLASGLAALEQALRTLAEVTVVAPEQNHSGASNSLTLSRPLTVRRANNGFHFINGTPTDCVHVALTGMLDFRPDLVVSGINDGQNMGDDTIYSGTVAAAMEGYLLGIPSIAFSHVDKGHAHLDAAAECAAQLIARIVARPLPAAMLLNVNIPNVARSELRGLRATRLGKRHPSEPVIQSKNPRGEKIWWVGSAGSAMDAGPGTDFDAVAQRYVSVTPLQIDLTHAQQLPLVTEWLESEGAT